MVKLIKDKKLVKITVARLCKLFGKSRQAFYSREDFLEGQYKTQIIVLELVAQIRRELPGIGTKKLYWCLREPFKIDHLFQYVNVFIIILIYTYLK